MMESPFVTTSKILNEPSNFFDDLRIIASGSSRLDTPTRDIIRAAADELEATQKALIDTQMALIEAQAKLIALNERLLEIKRSVPWNLKWEFKT